MAMGACPGQIPMPCVPPALMVTATMVRACRYIAILLSNAAKKIIFAADSVQVEIFHNIQRKILLVSVYLIVSVVIRC